MLLQAYLCLCLVLPCLLAHSGRPSLPPSGSAVAMPPGAGVCSRRCALPFPLPTEAPLCAYAAKACRHRRLALSGIGFWLRGLLSMRGVRRRAVCFTLNSYARGVSDSDSALEE